jgi:RimJ/RimL family protein N-acetyltransferase
MTHNSKLKTSASLLTNEHGQPIGEPVPGWTPRPLPPDDPMVGTRCRVERLEPARHVDDLWAAHAVEPTGRGFTYFSTGPFASKDEYRAWLDQVAPLADPRFFTIVDLTNGRAVGVASYLRIDPANGVIEVGNIHFSPLLQRTPAATEAMYLMMRRAFALGYRRYEWKCDALNAPSRRAAERFGFTFEGIFRQAIVYKGRNRDTAWYAIVDRDWPAIQAAFETWLAPANFDEHGAQRRSLGDLTRPARVDRAD